MQEDINKIVEEIREKRDMMTPIEASGKLLDLSSLLATLNTEIAERKFIFNKLLSDIMLDPKITVSRARVIAQSQNEYHLLDEAERLSKSLVDYINSLKVWIRSRQEEQRNTFN